MRLGLFLLVMAIAGCGNSLTGGAIPTGRAAIEGIVVDALDPAVPVADAVVKLSVDTDAATRAGSYTVQTRTDSTGAFTFTEIPEGEATVSITPPASAHGRPNVTRLQIRGSQVGSIAAAILPDDPQLAVASLTVTPDTVDTPLGTPVWLTATALLTNGSAIRPTWIVEGGVGRVNPVGRFQPRQEGAGQIRVIAGDQERVIPVTVRPAAD